ncbi:hypothetical protein [Galbibacter sp.]|uniref:hypothetical protein n=1 Tax=Galbibacter sp. TaxID=2918471 RepID=UPI003A91568A
MTIIEAILADKRDTAYLATLVDVRTKKSKEEIANYLHGTWRTGLVFLTSLLNSISCIS